MKATNVFPTLQSGRVLESSLKFFFLILISRWVVILVKACIWLLS